MSISSSEFATLLLVALMLGLAFTHALETPEKLEDDPDLYVTLQKSLYVASGPANVGGILSRERSAETAGRVT